MRRVHFSKLVVVVISAAGILTFGSGCGAKGKVLGKKPEGPNTTVLAIRAGDAAGTVTLQGAIVEKCPVAGCWFRIKDETGDVKVDTKAAGFVVTEVPLKTVVTVSGRIVSAGEEQQIEATGLRY